MTVIHSFDGWKSSRPKRWYYKFGFSWHIFSVLFLHYTSTKQSSKRNKKVENMKKEIKSSPQELLEYYTK